MVITYMVMDYSPSIYTDSTWHSGVGSPPSWVERMHYSLGGAGLLRTSVGCVLSMHGSGRVCPGFGGSRSRFALTGILEPQVTVSHALTLLGGARFIAWRLRRPFFRGMPTGPEAFLGMPSVSGTRPCIRTHLKKALCHTRLVYGTEDKYR